MNRKIIHIDMDAFYASIEQRDNPDYRGKPLAVGYGEKRGVVAAASYEARRYGVHSAMPSVTALRKCPNIIFVPPRFDVYRNVSNQIMQIFHEYTSMVEPLSLDEAFLDVTVNNKGARSATLIAKEIKQKIYNRTHLTSSAGVSYNKFLAKIASDYRKPDGLFVIEPEKAEAFVEKLTIDKFFGVGKVTAKRMVELGIRTGYDLKQWSELDLVKEFGKAGSTYWHFARGIDDREVESERVRKSLGAEVTFMDDLDEIVDILGSLDQIANEVHRRAQKRKFLAKTVTLKVKYADFTQITRSKTVNYYVNSYEKLFELGKELLLQVNDIEEKKIRLMGLTLKKSDSELSSYPHRAIQLTLDFEE
ncbi:MAG TPA: DNA polymerase IV [Fermentimonas caenicola]|uniref:DNA polymerase IV n=1 Tax=Lascolabacillus sp. TaxID=1924068 RepID=UPI0011FE6492|nr:DNA polymerase IV [Lascolabacillus sp.]MDI9625170.1 DNA polymerase IV [Bacteroidota bacterium]TAH61769.1 MAG: DNA polymerase IV [Fermentimonas caenicola]MDD2607309.1 DNA polymerase IV [Lascolabacillus sp.]MDD3658630.1 DNA polymerase IV [Lascolabacillus sp.]HHU40771.1 DNA polymerase IV [Fermentimonas caenicola]